MSFSDWGGSDNKSNGYQSNNPFGAAPPTRGHVVARGDDGDAEFQLGLQQVTEDIRQMTANFGAVSQLTKSLGGNNDNSKLRDTLQLKIKSTYSLVKQVQSSIKGLHQMAMSSSEKKSKIEKLSIDFENFNTKFKQLASLAIERMDDLPVSTRIDMDEPRYAGVDSDSDDRTKLLGAQQQQQYMKLEADREFQDSLIRQRDVEIREIQGQMIEVNEIFKDLARLVDDQAGMVDNIETNIISAAENVKVAKEEVAKAEESQISSRKKLIFFAIFIFIMVVVIALVVVFALQKKSD